MRDEPRTAEAPREGWVGWCCSYCSAPLAPRGSGLYCAAEGRWFASQDGVHRLLPEDRRRELLPYLELYRRVRRDEGWVAEAGLPEVPRGHRHEAIWRLRARHFERAMALVAERLGPGPWRVLEAGAGSSWASLRLLDAGHQVVATDVNLDPEDGLLAPNRFLASPAHLPRAEAEMEALPFEPGHFDLVLVAGALHHTPRLGRALAGDAARHAPGRPRARPRLAGLSAAGRRRSDGGPAHGATWAESTAWPFPGRASPGIWCWARSAEPSRRRAGASRCRAGRGGRREWMRDASEIAKHGRRTARFPILVGSRDV